MVKKKVGIIFLCFIVALGLFACGEKETTSDEIVGNLVEENVDATEEVVEDATEEVVEEATEEVIEEATEEVVADATEEVELTGEFKEFTAVDIYGNAVTEDIIKGYKLVMINIWATFCTPCLSEMPDLGELSEEYADKDVLIIGICADIRDANSLETAIEIAEGTGANYTHLQVEQFDDLYNIYLSGVQAVPETIFLDSTGTIIGSVIGSNSKSNWEKTINSYLE